MLYIKRLLLFFVFVVPVLICAMEEKDKNFVQNKFEKIFSAMCAIM